MSVKSILYTIAQETVFSYYVVNTRVQKIYNETGKQADRIYVVCISVNQCAIEMSIVRLRSHIRCAILRSLRENPCSAAYGVNGPLRLQHH